MAKPLLSIIYVNYNTTDLLVASVCSVKKQTSSFLYEIIVVDNNSKEEEARKLISSLPRHCKAIDSEAAQARRESRSLDYSGQAPQSISSKDCHALRARNDGQIQIIKNPENKGFGAANNLASKKATGQYLLFLNPDTLIVDDSISKMVEYLGNHQEVGALSPLLYNPDGQLQKHFYADNMSLMGITVGRWKGRQIDLKKTSTSVGMVSGAAMMVKKELFIKIGGFDEKFFMYQEDDDLCLRFQQAEFKNTVLTTAKVIHLEGQSSVSRDKREWYYQSQDYYFHKHHGPVATLIMKIIRLPYKAYKLISE